MEQGTVPSHGPRGHGRVCRERDYSLNGWKSPLSLATVRVVSRMPRSALPPTGIFHVTTRGVNGAAIYRDDDDRRAFLALFGLAARRHDWDVHVFCLLGNHYHLVIEAD